MKTILDKKINFKRYVLYFLLCAFFSCDQDILDVKNLSAFDPDTTWKSSDLSNAYLTGLYKSIMPRGWPNKSGALYGGITVDDKRGVINSNTISITSHPWAKSFEWVYRNIRKTNILLEEIEKGRLEKSVKNTIVGQALFLRAYSYFLLVRVYGGVPLLLKPQTLKDDLKVPRASTKEIFDTIIADLDKSLLLVKGQKFVDNDKGKIGEASVLAFKGRVLLYKASPLFNPNDPFSNQYWQDAYNITKLAKEKLEAMNFGLVENYNDIWSINNEGNEESILTVKFTNPVKPNGRGSSHRVRISIDSPVWSLVEKYPMKDGYPISSSPNYTYGEQNFWKDRDPRFEATIIYNAALFELENIKGRRIYTDPKLSTSERFNYSKDLSALAYTGLFSKKGIQKELSNKEASQNSVDWIEIRFAEVLLNYAEAANETGNIEEAKEMLKKIRKRAGIEKGTGNYGITATSKEELRKVIYDERFIEFIFEGQRFWTLKRTRTLTALDGYEEKGISASLKQSFLPIDKASKYEYLPEDFDYTVAPILKAEETNGVFSIPEKYYFAPIPSVQLQKNPKLEQTNSWGGNFDPTL